MEELIQAVLAGVEEAKSNGLKQYEYYLPTDSSESVFELETLVGERLPSHVVNHMIVTYFTGRVEKRLIVNW
jgi:hypothetical protein